MKLNKIILYTLQLSRRNRLLTMKLLIAKIVQNLGSNLEFIAKSQSNIQ